MASAAGNRTAGKQAKEKISAAVNDDPEMYDTGAKRRQPRSGRRTSSAGTPALSHDYAWTRHRLASEPTERSAPQLHALPAASIFP